VASLRSSQTAKCHGVVGWEMVVVYLIQLPWMAQFLSLQGVSWIPCFRVDLTSMASARYVSMLDRSQCMQANKGHLLFPSATHTICSSHQRMESSSNNQSPGFFQVHVQSSMLQLLASLLQLRGSSPSPATPLVQQQSNPLPSQHAAPSLQAAPHQQLSPIILPPSQPPPHSPAGIGNVLCYNGEVFGGLHIPQGRCFTIIHQSFMKSRSDSECQS
jgi:hypothetical protein